MQAAIPFGSYDLLERIAEGGMAEVWRARSRGVAGFEKTVVIKRVLPSLMERPGFAELLVREAKIAARLNHPNIIQIFDLGEAVGGYFIAMEYLAGRDLAAVLTQGRGEEAGLSVPLRLFIAGEVAKALDYAHRARGDDGKPLNIIHRDISPQNVLLGFEGEVKVADFGIARADESELGRHEDPRILRGKYAYMSPEQARGEELDRRSDIFSLGVVIYELLSRRRLFRGGSSQSVLERLRRGDIPDPSRHLGEPRVLPVLERALAADAEDRYPSAGELFADLVPVMYGGGPVGSTDLALAMRAMFGASDATSPNKLRVDLLLRAQDDAAAVTRTATVAAASTLQEEPEPKTRELPTSRRTDTERRTATLLAVDLRPHEADLFRTAVVRAAGQPIEGVSPAVAVFGAHGMERATQHAVRAALELGRRCRDEGPVRIDPVPKMAVVEGAIRFADGALLDVEAEAYEEAQAMLALASPGEVRIHPELAPQLRRDFRLETHDDRVVVAGYRSRRDRDASSLKRRSPLVGRRAVLTQLSVLLSAASEGSGSVVHLLGAPAMGKSRLLAELRTAAVSTDILFIRGRAEEGDRERPFAAFADLVMDLCGIEGEDPPEVRHRKAERLRVLGLSEREVHLLGELLGLAYPTPPAPRFGRPRGVDLALAVRRVLRSLAREKVVVLALEDLHWMDDATRQVLPLLVHGLRGDRLLVLITRRPGTGGPLPEADHIVELDPLPSEDLEQLATHWLDVDDLDAAFAAWLHAETGGVPGWVEPLITAMDSRVHKNGHVARLELVEDEPLRMPVPPRVRAAVRAWVAALRPRDRSMLLVAATFGGEVSLEELSAAEGLVGTTGRPSLRRLLVQRLLVPADPNVALPPRLGAWGGDEKDDALPSRVRMPSELLRRAMLMGLEERERRRLHGRVVSALERLGAAKSLAGLERLAAHASRSLDRRRAPDYRARAGEAALEGGEPVRATKHFAEAMGLQHEDSGDPADPVGLELGLRAVDAALLGGRPDLADEVLSLLRPALGRLEEEGAARVALADARAARRSLDPARVLTALAPLRELDEREVPSALVAEGVLLRGQALLEIGAIGEAREALEALVEQADDDPAVHGRALSTWGTALAHDGVLEEAEDAVGDALALAARHGVGAVRSEALAARAAVEEAAGDHRAAGKRYREAAEVAAEGEGGADAPSLWVRAAAAFWRANDNEASRSAAVQAERLAEANGFRVWGALAAAVRAAATGEPRDLQALTAELEGLSRPAEAALLWELRASLAPDADAAAEARCRAAEHAERAGRRWWVERLRPESEPS